MMPTLLHSHGRVAMNRLCLAKAAVALASFALMLGCAPARQAAAPAIPLPNQFKEAIQWRELQTAPEETGQPWWHAFGDPLLDELQEEALAANPTIAAANAAYLQARAALAESKAGLWPRIDMQASATRQRVASFNSKDRRFDTFIQESRRVAFGASWEPDIWGNIGAQIEVSRARLAGQDAWRAGLRLSVGALLAANYFALRQADTAIDLCRQLRGIEQQLAEMAQADLRSGRAASDDVLHVQSLMDARDEQLALLQRDRARFEHAVAALTGKAPADFSIQPMANYNALQTPVPAVLPSELLARRPDIVQAAHRVAMDKAAIRIASGAYFPVVTLGGAIGREGSTLAPLFDLPAHVWSLGPVLAATLVDGGARSARVDQAHARYDESAALYRSTVLEAFQEVEDLLAEQRYLSARETAAHQLLDKTLALARSQRKRQGLGLASRRDAMLARLTALEAELGWRSATGETLISRLLLIKSLGGGWVAPRDDEANAAFSRHSTTRAGQ